MKEIIKFNWGWVITLAVTLVSLGATYRGLTAQMDTLTAIQAKQDLRIAKVESVLSIMQQVEADARRIDSLEKLTVDSQRDRAGINAKLDAVKQTLDQLVNMHMKP